MTALPDRSTLASVPVHPRLFAALPAHERSPACARYLGYLKARDGEQDFSKKRLSRREAYFQEIERTPVRWSSPIDAEAFHRHHEGAPGDAALPPEILWLLIAAKANRAERFGVEKAILRARSLRPGADPAESYVELEEFYHTRILLDALRCFGLEVELLPPRAAQRAAVDSMVYLPIQLGLPVVLCAEICGATLFRLLLDEAGTLFAAQPEVRDRVQSLLREILVDEIGHIAYCRARMGTASLIAARILLPGVQAALLHDMPEVEALFGRDRLHAAIRAFDPAEMSGACAEPAFLLQPTLAAA